MAPYLIFSSPLRIRSDESADLAVTLMGLGGELGNRGLSDNVSRHSKCGIRPERLIYNLFMHGIAHELGIIFSFSIWRGCERGRY